MALCSVLQFHFAQRSLSKTLRSKKAKKCFILNSNGNIYSFPESLACFRGDNSCDRRARKRCGCRKSYLPDSVCMRTETKPIQRTTSPESLGPYHISSAHLEDVAGPCKHLPIHPSQKLADGKGIRLHRQRDMPLKPDVLRRYGERQQHAKQPDMRVRLFPFDPQTVDSCPQSAPPGTNSLDSLSLTSPHSSRASKCRAARQMWAGQRAHLPSCVR